MNKKFTRNIGLAILVLLIGATTAGAARMLWSETPPDSAPATPAGDPVEQWVRRETLAAIPELHQKPAPYVRIEIPDPHGTSRLMGLREQPVDNDAPVLSTSELPKSPTAQTPPPAPTPATKK